jgi:hypothetical protein
MNSKATTLKLALVLCITVALAGPTLAGLNFPGTRGVDLYTTPEAVTDAQDILVKLHYLRPDSYTTGVRDFATTRAIVAFQDDHAVDGTGKLDFDTMALLMSHGPGGHAMAKAPAKTETIARATVPAEEPKAPVVEAPPAPVVTPAPAPQPPPPAPAVMERTMPETDAPIAFIAGSGVLLLVAGLWLCVKRG